MKPCLIVIDVQESFRQRAFFTEPEGLLLAADIPSRPATALKDRFVRLCTTAQALEAA